MALDLPLHQPPTRPLLDRRGRLVNPIGSRQIELDDRIALGYEDLEPDTSYISLRFEYLTDEHALPARVRGALRVVPRSERVRHPQAQRTVGMATDSNVRLHGGHIVAVSLGGFASGPNLFPQDHNFNTSAYARLEHGWRRALNDGCSVEVDIALTLDPDPLVPQLVIVTYWQNGEEWEHPLLNEPKVQ
jgi:DNA/RNA non-specific endonuclease